MPSKEPNLLLKPHHLPYLAGGVAITLVVAVFALSLSGFLPTSTLAVVPTLSGGGPADAATAVAVDATVSIVSNVALGPASFGTWTSQTSGTSNQLGNIDAVSATTAWASGASGTVLRTTDSGTTWTTLPGVANANFRGLDAIDANTAWVAGGGGVIQKTTNAGSSWTNQTSGTVLDLFNISVVDTNTAWTVGDQGTILVTTNGGTTWTAQTSNTSAILWANHALDANTAWAAGASGVIRRTTNGGTTWATVDASGVTTQFNGIFARSSEIAWVIGNGGAIYKTTNGGTSWTAQTSNTTNHLNGISCLDDNTCWVAGDSGTVLYTDDGGSVWATQTSNTTNAIEDVTAVSATSAWFVGNSGTTHVFGYNNVLLQANTGNTQAGAPSGTNLCTSVTLASGVTLTCGHEALSKNTWYTFTLTTGVKSNTGDALAANVTRAFRTIGAPALSTASITNGQSGVVADAAITLTMDNPIAAHSVLSSSWEQGILFQDLLAVHAVSTSIVYVVGLSGTSAFTVDGGTTWYSRTIGSSDLISTHFVNAQIGWAVGASGTIQKTADGAASWATQTSGTAQNLNAVHAVSTSVAYVAGNGGTILKTTNGGTTWTAQTSGTPQSLIAVAFSDANTGWVAGSGGTILKTTNGGTTWTAQTSGTPQTLNGVHAVSTSVAYAVGTSSTILKTTDGGTTWTALAPPGAVSGRQFYKISCSDANTCWTVGIDGTILKTTDGATWSQQHVGSRVGMGGASFSGSIGWAVGTSGTILKTTNDGMNWTSQVSGTANDLNAIHAVSTSIAYAAGNNGTILKTTDGGTGWSAQTSGTSQNLKSMLCIDANTCWAIGASGTIIKTADGSSWSAQTSGTAENLFGLHAVDSSTVYAVGDGRVVLKTTNGGTAWTSQSVGVVGVNHGDVYCVNATTCWIASSAGNIYRTTDGSSWTGVNPDASVTWNGVHFTDANVGWIAGTGGKISKSTDGGANWTSQTSGTLVDLNAVSGDVSNGQLWVAGTAGVPMLTPIRNVRLTLNAGNLSTGAVATTPRHCRTVTIGADVNGNQQRLLTCSHGSLRPGTWYTLTAVGGSGGITATSGSSDVLAADVTRTLRTAFGAGEAFDFTASDMTSLASEGYFTVTGSNSAASQAVLGPELRVTATTTHGTARVTVPSGCVFARSGGGTIDLTALATADAAVDITNVSGTARGAIQYGIPNVGIALSSCGSGVSIAIPVASTVTAGTVLDVFRSEDTNFSNDTTRIGTCTVSSSTCSFTTTSLSYFAATEPSGSPTQTDTTAPAAPTGLSCISSDGKITCTWTDPSDTDLATLRILHIDSVSQATTLRGTVSKGVQTSTDSGTDLVVGTTYTVGVQAQDSSGNRSTTSTTTVTVSATAPAPTDTTTPSAPTHLTATSASSKVTLTWTDPTDADLKLIRVLLLRGEATSIRSTIIKGTQTFTDSGTDLIPGLPVTFALEAEDTAGNKSSRVTTTVTVDSGTAPTSPPTTNQPSTNANQPATSTPTTDGSPKTTDTTTPSTNQLSTVGSPKTGDTTTPVTPETELEKGIKADEPLPTDDPKATKLLKDAVKAITETLTPPCTLTSAERQYLADAFTRSQGRAPFSGGDLQFLCALRADPTNSIDPTKAFPKYRNLQAETLALKNFVNFFRRPPSRDQQDRPLPPAVAEKDWWAVKYMAYHLRLLPTARDLNGERICLKLFLDRDVNLYKDGAKTRKAKRQPPRDLFDYDFIRACTYSGVTFVSAAGAED